VIVANDSHQGAIDMQMTTIGLDIAKNAFQVHGIDASEKVVVPQATSARPNAGVFRGTAALAGRHGGVKAYVKRNKNDAADAEAICEAVRRPTMRFVQVKSAEQQGQLMLHRTRDLLMRRPKTDSWSAINSGRFNGQASSGLTLLGAGASPREKVTLIRG